MCKGEVYAISPLGNKEILSGITAKSLYEFYRNAVRENRIEFLYTGEAVYFDKIYDCLCEVFKNSDRCYKPFKNECYIKKSAENTREIIEDMPVNQGKLSIGMRTGITNTSDDIAPLIVANEIFGGSPNSKLFMNVREKMSLCYYCSSGLDAVKGLMFVNAGIETENFDVAKEAIFKQLDAVKRGEFTDEEFDSAVASLVNGYKSVSDSVTSLEAWYMSRIFRDEDDTPESRMEQVLKVTPEEVKAAAAKISPEVVFFLRGTLKEDEADE
jgi:predicted Zn-dependent peptidase